MKNKFREQTSQFLVVAFIGLLIIGFMFSGYESFQGQPDTIGEAGDYKIRYSEYQTLYNRNIQMLTRFNGGQPPSREEIERRQVKRTTIEQIIRQKVTLRIAEHLRSTPAKEKISNKIKDLPYFKTNDKFDITRYKGLLAANNITPSAFEKDIETEIKETSIQPLMIKQPISDAVVKEIQEIKKNSKLVKYVTITKSSIQNSISVSKSEIKKFLKDEKNRAKAEAIFLQNKSNYDTPAETEISHIALEVKDPTKDQEVLKKAQELRKKLNPGNFSNLADEHTEDPSHNKGTGGHLGRLADGMVLYQGMEVAFTQKENEISEPVRSGFGYHIYFTEKKFPAKSAKFESHQSSIATTLIRESKKDFVEKELQKAVNEIKTNFENGKIKKIKNISKKYALGNIKEKSINLLTLPRDLQLTNNELKKLLNSKKKEVFVFKNAGYQSIYFHTNEIKKVDESIEQIKSSLGQAFARGLNSDTLRAIEEIYPSKINQNLL